MKLLLDTQVFLWFLTGDRRLPPAWTTALRDPTNEVFLSVLSVCEARVKHYLGKLPLPEPPEVYLPRRGSGTGLPVCRYPRRACGI